MEKAYSIAFQAFMIVVLLAFSMKKANSQNLSLQSSFNVTNAVSGSGNAGIVYTTNEFWVSKWYTDSIATLTPSGTVKARFIVPGVSGIRAMTWDGSSIYAVADTGRIYKINPVTKTVTGIIRFPLVARHISYTATANGGAGGLWIGDDYGDLKLISLTGTTLQTIPAASHGLVAMWGSAYDSITSGGGPYLWIFDRGSIGNGANLVRIPVSTGVPDFTYNVLFDFPISGLAAGAFISYNLVPGQKTILTLLQDVPNIVARYKDAVPLPIKLVAFTGEKNGGINLIKWKTTSEQNSKGFELQRSADGTRFTTLGFFDSKAVNGSSTTELSYLYNDVQPLRGNNFYRLMHIDKNGNALVAGTLLLKSETALQAEINNIYPNPATTTLFVSINMPVDSKISLMVTDMKGSLLIKQGAIARALNNIFTIGVQSLPKGSYILKAIDNSGSEIGETKFIKQ